VTDLSSSLLLCRQPAYETFRPFIFLKGIIPYYLVLISKN
jgi:hypothetical protein